MYSKLILSDPYFHNNYDEKTAKEALNNADKGNFLFCPGKKENEIFLAYKAEYHKAMQVRIINLNYYTSDGSIKHNSLGSHSTLHSVSQALITFLHGWTSEPFSPIPFIKPPIFQPLKVEDYLIKPLTNNLVQKNIFTLFDKKIMATMVQVCKSWYQTGTQLQCEIEKQEFTRHQEENLTLNLKIKFIFETIKKKIPPEGEGVSNSRKILTYNGYSISKPMEYGGQIICTISTPLNIQGSCVFINKQESKIRLVGKSELLTNEDIQKLEDVCLYGKNPYVDYSEEEAKHTNNMSFK